MLISTRFYPAFIKLILAQILEQVFSVLAPPAKSIHTPGYIFIS